MNSFQEAQVIVVAGGRGTRLAPLTDTIPKPMVEVAGKSILEHTLNHFAAFGFRKFILCLCYLPEKIENYFGDGSKFGLQIEYAYEDPVEPLGSAGAVSLARERINGTFFVTYADIMRHLDLGDVWLFHKHKGGLATIALHTSQSPLPRSKVLFDRDTKMIEGFIEHPTEDQVREKPVWANGSLYVFEKDIFDYLPPGEKSDFGLNVFPKLVQEKTAKLYAYPKEDYFIDVGTIEKLRLAEDHIKSGKLRPYDNN